SRVFSTYIKVNTPIKGRTFFNMFEFLPRLRKLNAEKMNELNQQILTTQFESGELRDLYELLHPNEQLSEKIDPAVVKGRLDNIVTKIPANSETLRYYVALALYSWGYTDDVVAYLRGNINLAEASAELRIYCEALFYGKGDKVEL